MVTEQNQLGGQEITEKLDVLESRISRIEEALHLEPFLGEKSEESTYTEQLNQISDGSFIESKVGEFGLAWLGNIVLFFGIVFLVQFVQNSGHQIGASVIGYLSVAGVFILAHFLKSTFPKKVYIFNLNAWLLLFYVTLKLHFFTTNQVINNESVGLALLTIVTTVQLFFAFRKKSAVLGGVALLLFAIVAIVSNTTHFMLPAAVAISILGVIFLYRFGWNQLLYLSIILVYLIDLMWFLNNPIMSQQMQAIKEHDNGFIYLFLQAAVFSLVPLIVNAESSTKGKVLPAIILNGIGFSFLLSFYVLSFFKNDYVLLMSLISIFCLIYSVLLQLRSDWKTTAALYALYGFVTFSVSVYGVYGFPRGFSLLAIQSLIVVSMAIWFRSKFIVFMNTLLYVILLISYLGTSSLFNSANISFALVALVTARILSWKKDRLTIKTEMLRNVYLFIGFVMVLVMLYHVVPDRYITLSWTAVAVIYFVLSLILKNVKYRYISLGTMIAAAFYFFIIDLAKIELVYRIVALLFLAIISIGLSVFYTRRAKIKTEKEKA